MTSPSHTILLDHDNIEFSRVTVRELLELWIDADPALHLASTLLRLRAYGGWFVGSVSSDSRHRAAEFYGATAPSLFKHRGGYYSVTFEFADALVNSTDRAPLRIENTVVRRASTPSVTTIRGGPACPESDCELRATRRWLRHSRACARAACPMQFIDCFERVEQKQVDVHLAVDLMRLVSREGGQVALVTDDADILPALACVAESGAALDRLTVLRANRRPTYADSFLRRSGVRIVKMPNQEG